MTFLPVLRARNGFGFGSVNDAFVLLDMGTAWKEGRKESKRWKIAHRVEVQLGLGCDNVVLDDEPSGEFISGPTG